MTSKERLEQYIKEDTIYQDYLNKHSSYVSDFDKFCIQHCQDIKNILEENQQLKDNWNELKTWLEENWKQSQDIWFVKIINKMQELEGKSD